MKRLFLFISVLSLAFKVPDDTRQIPQPEVTFRLAFSTKVAPVDRGTVRMAFGAAIDKWCKLTPQQARFRVLPADTKAGVADFEVVVGPEDIDHDVDCLGMYDGHYTKGKGRIYGNIFLITEYGHWEKPRQAIPMSYSDYRFVAEHELGHLLGLSHHFVPHGIMDYFDHSKSAKHLLTCPTPDEIRDVKTYRGGLVTEEDKLRIRRGF